MGTLFAWLATLARLAMVLPFVLLSLLPQGFMPDRTAGGDLVLVLCTPDGPVEMSLDASGQPVSKAKPAPCHWAGAAAGIVLTAPVALPWPGAAVVRAMVATEADLWRPAYDPLGIWARGPPALI